MSTAGSQTLTTTLTTTQDPSKNLRLKFLCDLIILFCPTNLTLLVLQGKFLMRCLPLASKLFKLCEIEITTAIYITRPIAKSKFEVAM